MPHQPETEFHKRVKSYLHEKYGENNVVSQAYLEDTGRWADFRVESPLGVIYIEVENDFEAVFKGIGQAELYASHESNARGIVIFPEEHIEEPEYSYLSQSTKVKLFPF